MKSKALRSRATGLGILIISIIGYVIYIYFLLGSKWDILLLKMSVIAAIGALVTVLAWIGYTMSTTSVPDND
jgi:hypothetical protein